MEKTIVTTGKTIDLAIEAALTQLGLDRDSVSVQVLAQAKAGFLGFGAAPAKVQVTYEAPDPVPEKPAADPLHEEFPDIKVIGEAFGLYIICESRLPVAVASVSPTYTLHPVYCAVRRLR